MTSQEYYDCMVFISQISIFTILLIGILAVLRLVLSEECYFCEKRKMFFKLHMVGNLHSDEFIETCNTSVCKKCVKTNNLIKVHKDRVVIHDNNLKDFMIVERTSEGRFGDTNFRRY